MKNLELVIDTAKIKDSDYSLVCLYGFYFLILKNTALEYGFNVDKKDNKWGKLCFYLEMLVYEFLIMYEYSFENPLSSNEARHN